MKYDHMVKLNGVYYPTGAEVPNKADRAVEEILPPYSDKEIVLETQPDANEGTEKRYTKSEIQLMKTADLQRLAASVGIDGAEEMTGGTLKKLLIEHFGL